MFAPLNSSDRIVFFGDSVTAADRDTCNPDQLGHGYVRFIDDALQASAATRGCSVSNRGIDGDTVPGLVARFKRDVLAQHPSVVSILIGVNDCWNTITHEEIGWGQPVPIPEYADSLEWLLRSLASQDVRLVLVEPFIVPLEEQMWAWRADLNKRIDVVRGLARQYEAVLVPIDGLMNATCTSAHPDQRDATFDGVHPSTVGHRLIAQAWLAAVPHGRDQ